MIHQTWLEQFGLNYVLNYIIFMAIIYILGFITAQNINIHMSQVDDHKQDDSVIWDTNCDEGGFKQKLHRNTANQIIAFHNSIFFFFFQVTPRH